MTVKTFCSICSAFCGFEATLENDRIVSFKPDTTHPMSKGFSCSKGRHFHQLLDSPNRVTEAHKRSGDELRPVARDSAIDEIAEKLRAIIDAHGPESVAVYCGNGVTFKALAMPAVHSFMKGLGSHQIYTSLTIDQPAKVIATARHGVWAAGGHSFSSANVLMIIGNNVLVSGLHGPGSIPGWQPGSLKEARKRGMQLIVVDPRKTETAQQADLHLAIKPGTDAVLLSGMIRHILAENIEDKAFCEQHTEGLAELRAQVQPYTIERAAKLTGLDGDDIIEATRLFVEAGRGTASSATGPDMAPHANLTEHLINSLNTLCGRHNRAGDKVATSLLTPDFPPMESAVPFDFLPSSLNLDMNTKRSRVSGGRQVFNEMPTATLAEEILTPGEGQIKALLVVGGNPVCSIPEQDKTRAALASVELCVCIDGRFSETAEYADYVLPATYGLEKTDMTVFNDIFWGRPYHQISQPIVSAPGDALDEHQYLWALAHRLGVTMQFNDQAIDAGNPPGDLELLGLIFPQEATKVPVREIAAHPQGHVFEQFENVEVLPAMEGMETKLRFMPEGVAQEFAQLAQALSDMRDSEFLLICRRNPHVYNSMCHEFPQAPQDNPIWVNPDDMLAKELTDGSTVIVESAFGAIEATLASDSSLRPGVVAMTHGFGGSSGVSVNRLLSVSETTDNYARIPQMSAVPVQIRAG